METPPPVSAWRAKNETYIGGAPIATAGVVRSDNGTTFFSRTERTVQAKMSGAMAEFQLDQIDDFEVAVLE